MADAAKDKPKKRKSEVKKSDLPKKGASGEANSLNVKEKTGSRKSSTTPETAPSTPGLKIQAEVESVEEAPKKPKPILKVVADVEVESDEPPKPKSKPRAIASVEVEVDEPEAPPKPKLKPKAIASVEVEIDEPEAPPKPKLKPKAIASVEVEVDEPEPPKRKPILKPVATVEVTEDENETPTAVIRAPKKPVATVEVENNEPVRRASYVAPKAATRRDVSLLYELEEQKIQELREAFHLFDLNNDGFIDKEDLRNTYMSLGRLDIDDDEIQHMLSEAMNPLDFDAFVILLGYKSIELDPEEILREALAQWDYDESGMISEDRIRHDLMMWGDRFTEEEVEMALEDAPVFIRDNIPMIDYVKFCKILCGLRSKPKMPEPGDYPAEK